MASGKQQRDQREARDRLQRYQARQEVHAHQNKRRLRDNIFAIAGVLVVAALAATTQIFYFTSGPGAPTPEPSASETAPPTGTNVGAPDAAIAESRVWTGELTINDIALGIELDGVNAPQATAGWVQALETGYYPGKTCHRLATSDGLRVPAVRVARRHRRERSRPSRTARSRTRPPTASTRPARSRWPALRTTPTATATSSSS